MGKKSQPKAPNYAKLAVQQAELDRTASEANTLANRPNQDTPWGSTQWTKNADGTWNEKTTLNPAEQAALDRDRQFTAQQQGIASGLLGKAGQTLSKPMSLSGLPAMQGYNPNALSEWGEIDLSQLPELADSGFGAVEEVRDAMMGRLAPARAQSRDSEVQRLKNQGLSENSEAFQRAMTRLDQGDTDAQQQALLAATDAYGDIFDRSLAARGQMFGEQETGAQFKNQSRGQQFGEQDAAARMSGLLRQQSLSEQEMLRQSPLNDFLKLTQGTDPSMPEMPSFMGATPYEAADLYGAAKDKYGAQVNAANAKNAGKSNMTSGLVSLAGTAAMVF